ncbi:hypothetical protein H5V45_03510 [Nocardioides sp. KIGAM211]|uniref:Uncharacterized protein n=1 Tax=Nocardioides luti TaxID=2761101 RepID=A0A7X0V9W0_9ACTN|nr:hypothetical protein [Nocardioides luti]MBB6626382.1 hypothetical protein [Nocardioides luti]
MSGWSGRLGALELGLAVTLAAAGCTSDPATRPGAMPSRSPSASPSGPASPAPGVATVAFAPPPLPRAFRDVHPCGLSYVLQEGGHDVEAGDCVGVLSEFTPRLTLVPGSVFYVRLTTDRQGRPVVPVLRPSGPAVVRVARHGAVVQYRVARVGHVQLLARGARACSETGRSAAGECPAYDLTLTHDHTRVPRPARWTMRTLQRQTDEGFLRPYTGPARPAVSRAEALRLPDDGRRYVIGRVDYRSGGGTGVLAWHPAWVIGTATYVPDFVRLEFADTFHGFDVDQPSYDRPLFHPPRPGWLRGMWLYDARTGLMLRGMTS